MLLQTVIASFFLWPSRILPVGCARWKDQLRRVLKVSHGSARAESWLNQWWNSFCLKFLEPIEEAFTVALQGALRWSFDRLFLFLWLRCLKTIAVFWQILLLAGIRTIAVFWWILLFGLVGFGQLLVLSDFAKDCLHINTIYIFNLCVSRRCFLGHLINPSRAWHTRVVCVV